MFLPPTTGSHIQTALTSCSDSYNNPLHLLLPLQSTVHPQQPEWSCATRNRIMLTAPSLHRHLITLRIKPRLFYFGLWEAAWSSHCRIFSPTSCQVSPPKDSLASWVLTLCYLLQPLTPPIISVWNAVLFDPGMSYLLLLQCHHLWEVTLNSPFQKGEAMWSVSLTWFTPSRAVIDLKAHYWLAHCNLLLMRSH